MRKISIFFSLFCVGRLLVAAFWMSSKELFRLRLNNRCIFHTEKHKTEVLLPLIALYCDPTFNPQKCGFLCSWICWGGSQWFYHHYSFIFTILMEKLSALIKDTHNNMIPKITWFSIFKIVMETWMGLFLLRTCLLIFTSDYSYELFPYVTSTFYPWDYTLLATLFALGAVFSSATIIFMKVF